MWAAAAIYRNGSASLVAVMFGGYRPSDDAGLKCHFSPRHVLHQCMKKRIALAILAAALLVSAVGCELYTGISVTWTIDTYQQIGTTTRVTYTVQNVGQVDLAGVNLEIGVDNGSFYQTAWTASFSLGKGQVLHGSIDIVTGTIVPVGATVLSIDMDKPA
jgi:hypothetical protein